MVEVLMEGGVAIDARNYDGRTALHIAASIGETESVQALLTGRNTIVDTATNDGVTALMMAAEKGHVEIAKLLLDHGASKTRVDDNGHAAEYYLSHEGEGPGLDFEVDLDLTDYDTPRNHIIVGPSPEEAAELRANHEAIRELLEQY